MEFTVNKFEFERNDNFDLFNDLELNSVTDIMPNIYMSCLIPSTDQPPTKTTISRYRDIQFGNQNKLYFTIPCIYIRLTEENNIWRIGTLTASVGNDYSIVGKDYYESRYQYYNSYEVTEIHRENFSTSISSFLTPNFTDNQTGYNRANNASYLTDDLNYSYYVLPLYYNTNIPIILVDNDFDSSSNRAKAYMQHQMTLDDFIASDVHILGILNGPEEVIPPEVVYEVTCIASQYTVDEYGEKTQTSAPTLYRGFRIKSRKKVSLFRKEGIINGNLEYGILFDDATICYYSSGDPSFSTWQNVIGNPTILPFDFIWRYHEDEQGTFYCADSIKSTYVNVPIWKDEEDAEEYNDGNKGIEDAENFNEISGKYDINNPTGEQDENTIFGQNLTEQFFTRCYLCNVSNLREISNALFDYDVTTLSGLWDDIKKGLEMYGSNPMEVVQGLRFYPFDISEIFSDTSSDPYVYFGAYKLDLNNGNVLKVYHPNGYKTLGTVHLYRTFKDWRDFEPYTKLSIYLPYIGRYPLQASRYYDKDVEVRYYVDIRTGLCCACLIGDGILLDWFDGQIGTEMPITLTDYSSYAQTQINTILRNATMGAAAEGTIIGTGIKETKHAMQLAKGAEEAREQPLKSSLAAQTATVGAVGATVGGYAAAGGLVLAGMGIKTAYDLMKTGTSAFTTTKGSSSSLINSFLPQYPTFMFEIVDIDESPFLNELYGRPTNASGRIGDFSGYLEAEDIMLICPIATDTERQEIIDLVKSGIYI